MSSKRMPRDRTLRAPSTAQLSDADECRDDRVALPSSTHAKAMVLDESRVDDDIEARMLTPR